MFIFHIFSFSGIAIIGQISKQKMYIFPLIYLLILVSYKCFGLSRWH